MAPHNIVTMIFELDQDFPSIPNPPDLNYFVAQLMCNQCNHAQSDLQVLSSASGDNVLVFMNPQDEKEWRKGFTKHCTNSFANGRYPEDCFLEPSLLSQ